MASFPSTLPAPPRRQRPLPAEERLRRERRRRFSLLVAGSLLLHAALICLAARWLLARHAAPDAGAGKPLPFFSAVGVSSSPAGGSGAAGAAAAALTLPAATLPPLALPPSASDRLVGTEPAPSASDAAAIPAAPAPAPAAAPGTGTGQGNSAAAGAGAGMGSGSFGLFGVGEGEGAARIVVALDVSDSMFVRQPGDFERIAAETARALDTLDPKASFDVVVFEGGSLAWKPQPVPADVANRSAARAWLEGIAARGRRFTVRSAAGQGTLLYEGGGTRGDTMLRQAFALRPDLVIVLTDGQWDDNPASGLERPLEAAELSTLVDTLEKALPTPARIDLFCLRTARSRPAELAAARALAERSGGRYTELPGPDLAK